MWCLIMKKMIVNKEGLKIIKKYEGFRNHPYEDASGIPRIGYGNMFYDDGTEVLITDEPITIKKGIKQLRIFLKGCESMISRLVEPELNQNQFDALISLIYKIGLDEFENSELLKKINNNPEDETIKDEFLKWNKKGGKVNKMMKKRRNEEAYLFFKPML